MVIILVYFGICKKGIGIWFLEFNFLVLISCFFFLGKLYFFFSGFLFFYRYYGSIIIFKEYINFILFYDGVGVLFSLWFWCLEKYLYF